MEDEKFPSDLKENVVKVFASSIVMKLERKRFHLREVYKDIKKIAHRDTTAEEIKTQLMRNDCVRAFMIIGGLVKGNGRIENLDAETLAEWMVNLTLAIHSISQNVRPIPLTFCIPSRISRIKSVVSKQREGPSSFK